MWVRVPPLKALFDYTLHISLLQFVCVYSHFLHSIMFYYRFVYVRIVCVYNTILVRIAGFSFFFLSVRIPIHMYMYYLVQYSTHPNIRQFFSLQWNMFLVVFSHFPFVTGATNCLCTFLLDTIVDFMLIIMWIAYRVCFCSCFGAVVVIVVVIIIVEAVVVIYALHLVLLLLLVNRAWKTRFDNAVDVYGFFFLF